MMRLRVTLLMLAALVLGGRATHAQAPLHSIVFPADSARNRNANMRFLMDTLTPTLDKLEIHETTLAPGKLSHAPHRHAHEEVIYISAGTIDVFLEGKVKQAKTGAVVFLASNEFHAMRNAGGTDARYIVVRIDAKNIPADMLPFFMSSPPEGWRQP